ncbi:unnamed protein product [Prorocentrum cordatum]|uniref:Uncharacterized protein n=1 Tax=Prorocentrum cordatum TaxID=2364126 RepID=A0ABN9QUD8_9DINO|nr:unnamed protein product [Polarella glacialis]
MLDLPSSLRFDMFRHRCDPGELQVLNWLRHIPTNNNVLSTMPRRRTRLMLGCAICMLAVWAREWRVAPTSTCLMVVCGCSSWSTHPSLFSNEFNECAVGQPQRATDEF